MEFTIRTLVFSSSLIFLTQLITLFVQYIINKNYKGVLWWLLGSIFWALGVILMPMTITNSIKLLSLISNPITIIGEILIYIGITIFFDKKRNWWILISIFMAFTFFHIYFTVFDNDISKSILVLSTTLAVISFMTASILVFSKNQRVTGSAIFIAIAFIAFGCFSIYRIFWVLLNPPMEAYTDQGILLELSFIIPIITSLLWTFSFIIMLNQRLNTENWEEREKLQLIFNTSPDAEMISRLFDGFILDVNVGFVDTTGYSRTELINNTTLKINIWHRSEDREVLVQALAKNGSCKNMEYPFVKKDGSLFYGSIAARIISLQGVPHVVSVVHDITYRKQAEDAIRESESLYRSILDASPDSITITDLSATVLVVSPAAKKIFGYAPSYDQFVGSSLFDFIIPEEHGKAKKNIVRMFNGENIGKNEYHGLREDRSTFNIEVNSGIIYGADNSPDKMVFIVRDITERKQTEIKIQELVQQLKVEKMTAQLNANTDSLTGLANRRYFDEALNLEFHRLKRAGTPLSLIMLDVDYFKKYNDNYGHLAGDDCLRQVALTLKTSVARVTDLVARYGGEEFVALLTNTDQHGAITLAERIRQAIEDLAIPHIGSDISNVVTVSLGVTTIHTANVKTGEQIVALADKALYCAKEAGRNQISVLNEKENHHT
jgi:diguanylate cyclase (GGDEF)-like protein/PAS domain S-box-containing protein